MSETQEAAALKSGAASEPEEEAEAPRSTAEVAAERRELARLMTYRLFPLWLFLLTFGVTLTWEAATQGNALAGGKLQAAEMIEELSPQSVVRRLGSVAHVQYLPRPSSKRPNAVDRAR